MGCETVMLGNNNMFVPGDEKMSILGNGDIECCMITNIQLDPKIDYNVEPLNYMMRRSLVEPHGLVGGGQCHTSSIRLYGTPCENPKDVDW